MTNSTDLAFLSGIALISSLLKYSEKGLSVERLDSTVKAMISGNILDGKLREFHYGVGVGLSIGLYGILQDSGIIRIDNNKDIDEIDKKSMFMIVGMLVLPEVSKEQQSVEISFIKMVFEDLKKLQFDSD